MQPTLETDDVLLVNKLSRHFSKKIEIGKIYIFISPTDPEKLICKRIIAAVNHL
jgi:signal peptidase I